MSAANADFELFRVFLEKTCGIVLGSNKQYLVSSRLNKLMEQQGIKSLGELVQRIQTQRGGLREMVVDAMTTNETLWFRDTYPFEVGIEVTDRYRISISETLRRSEILVDTYQALFLEAWHEYG